MLKSMPMKKPYEHLVVKLFTSFGISNASTFYLGFGMCNFGEIDSGALIVRFASINLNTRNMEINKPLLIFAFGNNVVMQFKILKCGYNHDCK
jgi:hypothetical protein